MAVSETIELRRQPHVLWPHLLFATLLSTLVPYLGSAYLGLPARNEEQEWQRRTTALSILFFAVVLFPRILNFELLTIALVGGIWTLLGLASAVSLLRAAWGARKSIWVVRGGWLTSITVFNIAMLAWLGIQQIRLPNIALISAPHDTPLVETGESLYGFEYDARRIQLQRGQLVVARLNYKPTLVRILAVPGDIFASGQRSFQVNGFKTSLAEKPPVDPSRQKGILEDVVEAISNPDQRSSDILVADGFVAVKGTDGVAPQVLLRDEFIVAFDAELIGPSQPILPTIMIERDDIVSVPWAKFWSIVDHPGRSSDLVQPSVILTR